VLHFGKARKSENSLKVGKGKVDRIFVWVDRNFAEFIGKLDDEFGQHWHADRADPDKFHETYMELMNQVTHMWVKNQPTTSTRPAIVMGATFLAKPRT
jgi:hypothetical protein